MSIKSALKTISLIVTASSDEKNESVRRAAIHTLARPPFVPSAPTAKKLWSLKEQEQFYKNNPVFSAKPIPVYEGQWCTSACYNDYDCPHEERFEEEYGIVHLVVKWSDHGKMNQISDNVFLK